MHQSLRRVPDDVTDGLLGVNPEQVLEDGEEGDLLGRVVNSVVDCVEHVQVGGEVNIMSEATNTSLVTLTLLFKHIQLNLQIRVLTLGFDVLQNLQQLES